jgi:hypothetical protein
VSGTGPALTEDLAARFAAIALANVVREYPSKQDHVLGAPGDAQPTRALHPAFYGSYDWHSCVHMHWLLVRLYHSYPRLPQRTRIGELFDRHFAPDAIAGECAYLERPGAQAFERTYGWAWLLKLAAELGALPGAAAARWAANIAPLAAAFVARYLGYLPRAHYPIRHGTHANSAFGLAFALDYARAAGALALEHACVAAAGKWFGADRDAPAAWEPCGADFLSPTLMEAELMRRVLPPAEFADWLAAFVPGLAQRAPATLFTPVAVADRADPQIVHLDGLNLSRAWCMRGIAAALPPDDPRVQPLRAAAHAHLGAGTAGLDSSEYVIAHWLATFAVLASCA